MQPNQPRAWSMDDASQLYLMRKWSAGYFGVSPHGTVVVRPRGPEGPSVDLHEIVCGLQDRGIFTPVLIGFPDLLVHRISALAEAFAAAMANCGYRGHYSAVYPIKVNQHRHLVERVERVGSELGFGLEVGSKPELLAVMGLTASRPDQLIVCNGFKEACYIQQVLLASRLGRNIVVVIENISELELLIHQARGSAVWPRIGIRYKLAQRGRGRWQDSSGEKAKFGLSIPGILEVVTRLREIHRLDRLVLLHCHMGSQITDIQVVNSGVSELTQVFTALHGIGVDLKYLDVGGGIGIDYDGSRTNSDFSTNYTLAEYAATVVSRVASVCDDAGAPHPTLITEAGRAMVGHHSVLVCDVLGADAVDRWELSAEEIQALDPSTLPGPLTDLMQALQGIASDRLLEAYQRAEQARDEALTSFGLGRLSLQHRELVDRLFWSACLAIDRLRRVLEQPPEELLELNQRLSDTYFCNLSVFQSLPDAWAIDQVFPIVPLHRLHEQPQRQATLADITCDSDGRLQRFVGHAKVASTLSVHALRPGETYFLGIFLVGAYQETLGDLHNLFGDTHLVHITVDDDSRWSVEEMVEGDRISDVLGYLQYEPRQLLQAIRRDCEKAVRKDRITAAESREILTAYEQAMADYTYLSK